MAGDAATNAAESVRPKREELEQVDRPAPDNTWHDAPDMSREALRGKFRQYSGGNSGEKVRTAAAESTPQDQAASSLGPGDPSTAAGPHRQADASSGADVTGSVDNRSKYKVEAKREEYRERAKHYFSRKMPQERRDQTVWRLKVLSPTLLLYLEVSADIFCRK